MLGRYERILDAYKTWHPGLYKQTVECRPSGRNSILVTLDDESKLEYNSCDNTIRNVTKLYSHEQADNMDEDSWRKEFGHKLRRAIFEKGINQDRLAEMSGISRQMLTRYVRGTSTPSGYILTRLCEVLDCDVRELTKFGYIDEE